MIKNIISAMQAELVAILDAEQMPQVMTILSKHLSVLDTEAKANSE